jgi:hypothetical protein
MSRWSARMATSKAKVQGGKTTKSAGEVDQFMKTLEHPFKAEIGILRRAILAADSSIADGIKWNSPSFRTSEYFATTNLRAKAGIGLILHLGAKVRELPGGGIKIADPAGLLKWLGKDRAMVQFATRKELEEKTKALQALLRQWIAFV